MLATKEFLLTIIGWSIAAFLALALMAPPAKAQGCQQPADIRQKVTEVSQGLASMRRAAGLPPIRADRQLTRAAQRHACDLARHGQMSHQGADGSNSHQRVLATGFRSCLTAENLAWGYPEGRRIIQGWYNSAKHRRNMMEPRMARFGVGVAEGPRGPMWVMVLAKAC